MRLDRFGLGGVGWPRQDRKTHWWPSRDVLDAPFSGMVLVQSIREAPAMKIAALMATALVALTAGSAIALRVEVQDWPHRLSHNIPAWETHCLNEVFSREGLDAELLRIFGINADDPQVVAIRRYCESHQSAVRSVPGLWPAAGHKLGRIAGSGNKTSRYRRHGLHHLGRHKGYRQKRAFRSRISDRKLMSDRSSVPSTRRNKSIGGNINSK